MNLAGRVLWITGLSGSGKTTLAREVVARLVERDIPCLHLDGDRLREVFADPSYGFDRASRLAGAFRYARLAGMAAEQGLVAVVSTISLFHEIHAWNRANLPRYFEVYLDASEEVRRRRDPKGLYKAHDQGANRSMGGLDLALELPLDPHLRLSNDGGLDDLPRQVGTIVQAFAGT